MDRSFGGKKDFEVLGQDRIFLVEILGSNSIEMAFKLKQHRMTLPLQRH
jgi:hypothetical protein